MPNQTFVIDSYNPGTNINIPGLAFSTSEVRAAFIRYSVYRNTNSTTVYEAGQFIIVYNANNSINQKWEVHQNKVNDAQITFTVLDTGQVQFTTTTVSGINHTGVLSFTAQSLLQS